MFGRCTSAAQKRRQAQGHIETPTFLPNTYVGDNDRSPELPPGWAVMIESVVPYAPDGIPWPSLHPAK